MVCTRTIIISGVVVAAFFGATLWAFDAFLPGEKATDKRPALAALPPLPPVTRTSSMVVPIAVALTAIRDTMEAAAPRNLAGKRDNPLSDVLSKADIGWTIGRGPLALAGRTDGLAITTPLNGSLRVTGQIATQAGNISGALTGILGNELGRAAVNIATRALDQRADIRGNVTVLVRPTLQPNWRMEPNLTGQVTIAEGGMAIAGVKLNVSNEVKPWLDRSVNEQIAALQNQLRNDQTLEQTAQREWTRMCRSISLGAAAPGAPNLWLELRPTRALAAAQPRIDPNWIILTVGVQAETRVVPGETKPTCPFPVRLEFVSQMDQGKIAIAVPIDVPFTELNRILEAQLKGKTFPDDKNAAITVTVQKANVAASGDRLLMSLRLKAHEKKSWFGFGAEATVHVWGKPVLDQAQQILRLTEIELAVESEAAFGLLGAAAQAAKPQLQAALAENAVADLKPFAANALKSIDAAIAEFQKQGDGVRAETALTGLRLVGIAFDSATLRVIAEAEGTARALVTKLAAP